MGLIDIVFDFVLAGERMHHVCNGTDFVNCVEHINRFGSVRHAYRNTVALLGAERFQRGGDFIDFLDKLFVGNLCIEILQGRIVWPLARRLIYHIVETTFRILNVLRHFFYIIVLRAL